MGMKQIWMAKGTRWLLIEFAKWTHLPPMIRLNYPTRSAFVPMQGRRVKVPAIDPDLACDVQIWLNELEERDYKLAAVIQYAHLENKPMSQVAERMSISVTKAKETLLRAEAWIDCKLNDYFKMTEAQRQVYKMRLKEAS